MTLAGEYDDHPPALSDTLPDLAVDLGDTAAFHHALGDTASVGLLETVVSRRVHPELDAPDRAAPAETGTVYVLRRHRRHLVAGILLARMPRLCTTPQAKSWAGRQVAARLRPWEPFDEADPDGGWHTTSGLLVEQYALYRHPGGWHLVGVVSRIPRPRIVTDDDAQAWAADVLRPAGPLSWERGPATVSATTWYAVPAA
ncbi:hypothetical protein [Nonomuraea polychroma]|uniref:hypothetical protein n=1 Tax=Nonomuraea polychroma TaxID=46176 RepID=UPI000FDE0020|nr:hypothetical protein [Nonomuraea polychroma]